MKPRIDLFVMTTAAYHTLWAEAASAAKDAGRPVPLNDSDLFQAPVEHFPELGQVLRRAAEAHNDGQLAMMILE